ESRRSDRADQPGEPAADRPVRACRLREDARARGETCGDEPVRPGEEGTGPGEIAAGGGDGQGWSRQLGQGRATPAQVRLREGLYPRWRRAGLARGAIAGGQGQPVGTRAMLLP